MEMQIESLRSQSTEVTQSLNNNLIIKNLSKQFGDAPKVLNNVSFEVEPAQLIALIGSEVSGKSTLLRCLAGSLAADAGEVIACGQNIARLNPQTSKLIKRKLAYLDGRAELKFAGKVINYVIQGAKYRMHPLMVWAKSTIFSSVKKEALSYLEMLGCSDCSKKKLLELSPLEKRKIAFAVILMQEPEVILADDPAGDLNLADETHFMNCFIPTVKKLKKTLIFTTRDLVDALAYADRALALHEGRLELDAPIGNRSSDTLKAVAA